MKYNHWLHKLFTVQSTPVDRKYITSRLCYYGFGIVYDFSNIGICEGDKADNVNDSIMFGNQKIPILSQVAWEAYPYVAWA